MNLDKRTSGSTTILKPIRNELTIDFKNQALNSIDKEEHLVLFDFSGLQKINSDGLTILISLYKALKDQHRLGIFGLNGDLSKLIELTGLIKIIPLFETEEEGIKYFQTHQIQ